MQQKKVYRQKLIRYNFIFMLVWIIVFTAVAVMTILSCISRGEIINLPVIIACGGASALGWIIFAPMCIHRKKITLKDGMLFAPFTIPKVYDYVVDNYHDSHLKHIVNLPKKIPRFILELNPNPFRTQARIARFSWRVYWQRIDLSQIIEISRHYISIPTMLRTMGWQPMSADLEIIMLRDRYGAIHLVEITDFSEKTQKEIFDFIQENKHTYLPEDERPVNNARPQSKRRKKEAELAAQKSRRIALQNDKRRQLQELIRAARAAGRCCLILMETGTRPIAVREIIQEITGKSESEAKEITDCLPSLIISDISREDAMIFADRFAEASARVAINTLL